MFTNSVQEITVLTPTSFRSTAAHYIRESAGFYPHKQHSTFQYYKVEKVAREYVLKFYISIIFIHISINSYNKLIFNNTFLTSLIFDLFNLI